MFSLSKNETRFVLVVLAVIFSGSGLNYLIKRYPHLLQIVNLVDSEWIYPWYDVNTASADELVQIPYIGNYTARAIIRFREERGPVTDLEQLKEIPGIRDANFQRFAPYLRVRRQK
ncbi:MAG: helix-hairpin-helix domain-containing protein [Candidatus Omnitrophica bacterium]|nr:helix-hairpin-helix domain-containing protein [Candidatus Omnitrophota bacterium]MCB9719890.1 helix-hairpin-helix domain-containing protein [Candidatus Omnitrophota bacterium]